MKNNVLRACVSACMLSLFAAPSFSSTLDAGDVVDLNDGAVFSVTASDGQSTFANEFAINSDETDIGGVTYGTGTVTLGDVSFGDGGFIFAYDIQETGNDPETNIADIIIEVDGVEIWSYSGEELFLNAAGSVETDSPLGNGADAILTVPFDLFLGFGFSSDSVLTFLWLQTNDDNGADEWVLSTTGTFVDGPIDAPAPVPLPAGLPLLLAGLGGFGALKMRRRR